MTDDRSQEGIGMLRVDVDLVGQPHGHARSRIVRSTLNAVGTAPTTITFTVDPAAGSGNVAVMVRGALRRTGQSHGPVTVNGPTVTVNPTPSR